MTNAHQSSALPQSEPSVAAAQTGTLSITTDPSPLAVTVYDRDMNTVAQAVSPARISLAPGLYMVRASRVGRPDLTQLGWVVSRANRSVHLSESEPTRLQSAATAISGALDQYFHDIPAFAAPQATELAIRPDTKQERFWIRFLRLKDWSNAERVELPAFSSHRDQTKVVLDITNPHQHIVFAQVARPGVHTVNVAIPPGGTLRPVRCHLVVASEKGLLQAHVRLSTDWANSALQYMALGYYEEAKHLVEGANVHRPSVAAQVVEKVADWFVKPQQPSGIGRIVQGVLNRFDDPAAALVPRYLGLRTRDDTVFNTLGDSLLDVVQGLSDGLVISAEIAARQGLHKIAALHILSIKPGGLPLFAEGFSMLLHRIKDLIDLNEGDAPPDDPPSDAAASDDTPSGEAPPEQPPGADETKKLSDLQRTLDKWAPFLNVNSPTVTFRGNDITAPKENEESVAPTAAEGWISGPEPIASP
jgi:hypothetical protein